MDREEIRRQEAERDRLLRVNQMGPAHRPASVVPEDPRAVKVIAEMQKGMDALKLQVGKLQKDLAHWKDCHGATADKLEESNRRVDEMRKALELSLPKLVHHLTGHVYDADSKLTNFVAECEKCVIQKALVDKQSVPVQIESDGCAVCGHPMEGHDIAGNCEKHGCDCSL